MKAVKGQPVAILLVLSATVFALCFSAEAQQPMRVARIGYIGTRSSNNRGPLFEAFRQGLRDLGYIEQKNIVLDYRSAEGDQGRLPSVVAELMHLKIDVLFSGISPAIRIAKQAIKTTPIVMVTNDDPVAIGLVDSLAHPGGNLTGLTLLNRDLSGKRLELLKESIPTIYRVGVVESAGTPPQGKALLQYETVAHALKIKLQSVEVHGPNPDWEYLFDTTKPRVDALILVRTPLLTSRYSKRIAELAIKNRLPSAHEYSGYVEVGGLMSYAANDGESFRRAATYVDKILKGAKPADLPVEQPTKFELLINLKTAKQIGLTIPPNVLARADRVIR